MFIPSVAAMKVFTAPFFIGLTTGLWTGILILLGSADLGCIADSGCVAFAQVTSDGTLSTTVIQAGNNFAIDQGDRVGNNLFHSFGQFSVPTGGAAIFNNAGDIQNIFSRVTGGSLSNIDGRIQANGAANLFLLNPSGILFGSNASLNIGGSFIGTTANSIRFADGAEFTAVNPPASAVLTMSVPTGLQLGRNSAALSIQGSGHTLAAQHPTLAPYLQAGGQGGLAVAPGQTLALIGGILDFNGGVVTAPGGHVELGAIAAGTVQIETTPTGLRFDNTAVERWGDIQLQERSLVDVNGLEAGSIRVRGRQISLTDGSVLWVQNRGSKPAGLIQVNASERLIVSGSNQGSTPNSPINSTIVSSIVNETVGSGAGGNIQISAPETQIEAGAGILAKTYTDAVGGTIAITTQNLTVQDYIPQSPDIFSSIAVLTFGSAPSGNLMITTQQMRVQAGGFVGSSTMGGGGRSGDVQVQAAAIAVDGATPTLIPSVIGATTLGNGGDSGNLSLNTGTLRLTNSGFVTTSSIGVGSAGDLVVQASEGIDIGGRYAPEVYQSAISSNVTYPIPAYIRAFGLTEDIPRGAAGSVTVITPRLRMWDKGTITTSNDALGDAGTVRITAAAVTLDRAADITAFTRTGVGGNVEIQAQSLFLRDNSLISATAGGLGNGGNITLRAGVVVGVENSDIAANAVQGQGGTIQITTQGIFGLKFRPQLTSENDITASSEFGVDGTVDIVIPGLELSSGFGGLPVELADATQQIAQGCVTSQGSSFVITGRGGLPPNPMTQVSSDRPWTDTRSLSLPGQQATNLPQPTQPTQFLEATGWRRNAKGDVEVYAAVNTPFSPANAGATCANSPASAASTRP